MRNCFCTSPGRTACLARRRALSAGRLPMSVWARVQQYREQDLSSSPLSLTGVVGISSKSTQLMCSWRICILPKGLGVSYCLEHIAQNRQPTTNLLELWLVGRKQGSIQGCPWLDRLSRRRYKDCTRGAQQVSPARKRYASLSLVYLSEQKHFDRLWQDPNIYPNIAAWILQQSTIKRTSEA